MTARRLRGWIRALLRRDAIEREMDDEMRLHLERATERLIARGMSARDAHAEARREFGNVGYIQEEARDARGVRWIEEAMQDLRYGARALIKAPTFTVVAVSSLVLGIGVNTAIFTALNALMRPRVIDEPRTFVSIPQTWSKPAYDYLLSHTPALSEVIARSDENVLLAPGSAADEPRRASAELVSGNYFSALRAPMTLGRSIGPDDLRVGSEPIAVLNFRYWKSQFSGDSTILGRVVRFANGTPVTVVGVAGRDFAGVRRGGPDIWLPLSIRSALPAASQAAPKAGDWFGAANYAWITVYGRLADGHTADEAQTQINLALRQLAATDSGVVPGVGRAPLAVVTAETADAADSQGFVKAMFLAATFIVLLVACFNVASLMLARATDRQREIAVRLSLGAGRSRIVRQLITESVIVVGAGAALAFALSMWTLRALAMSGGLSFITDDDPDRLARALMPNVWVFGFALGLATLSVVACGLLPALRATRPDLASALKTVGGAFGANPRSRMRAALTMAQVALSVVLLVAAGMLTRSMLRTLSLDIGFERARVLTVSSELRLTGYDTVRVQSMSRAFERRLAELPGVRFVARGDVPLVGGRFKTVLMVPGKSGAVARHDGYLAAVTPAYFAAVGIPIVRGRAFDDAELRSRAHVVVVSEATARALWPNDDPLGKVVNVDPMKKGRIAPETVMPSAVVIGVARDAQMVNLGEIPPVYVYLPSASGGLMIRADGDIRALAPMVRDAARAIDPNLLVASTPLSDLIATNGSIYNVRFAAGFASAIGGLTLTLASVGIFGLMAYAVSQRRRELGIRMALGAQGYDVVKLVLGQGLRVVLVGAGIGIAIGAVGTRLLRALLFGMSPLDPIAYGAVGLVVGAVALIACYIPARRATRVDPLVALKAE